jgi:hypothetical protein
MKTFFATHQFKATVDVPYAWFPEEIMTAFPKTKFILTTRDPVSWFV